MLLVVAWRFRFGLKLRKRKLFCRIVEHRNLRGGTTVPFKDAIRCPSKTLSSWVHFRAHVSRKVDRCFGGMAHFLFQPTQG